jgi:hypothetical protein
MKVEHVIGVMNLMKRVLIDIVGGGVQLGPLGTAATDGLSCHQPRVIMMMEKLVE